jgi:hypothetical protein
MCNATMAYSKEGLKLNMTFILLILHGKSVSINELSHSKFVNETPYFLNLTNTILEQHFQSRVHGAVDDRCCLIKS